MMTRKRYVKLSLQRKAVQNLVLIFSLTITLFLGLLLTKFLLISHERFSTLAREGEALIVPKGGDLDQLLAALNMEKGITGYIPFNLYQTIYSQIPKNFEDGKKIYTRINQVIPFLAYGLVEKQYHVLGTNQDFLHRFNFHDSLRVSEGRWFNDDSDDEIVIGKNIAKKLSFHLNDSIAIEVVNSEIQKKFKIVGILEERRLSWDNGAYTSISAGQKALGATSTLAHSIWQTNVLTHLLVYISPTDISSLKSLINDRTISQFISIPETIEKLERLTWSGASMTSLLVLLVALLGFCAIFGVMITRADNTMNSWAILHSLGYSKKDIVMITFGENFILCSLASLLAFLFYSVTFLGIQQNIVLFSNSDINLWSDEFAYILLFLNLGVGMLSLLPLILLNKRGIHNILRTQ